MRCYQLVLDDAGYIITGSQMLLAGLGGTLGFLIGGPVGAGIGATTISSIPSLLIPNTMDYTVLKRKVKDFGYDMYAVHDRRYPFRIDSV
jgi:hypothetical protein